MRTRSPSFKSTSAKRLLAPLNRQGWNFEVTHGDGTFKRGGRRWQDVPWCKISATHSPKEPPVTVRVKELNEELAEMEAATELLKVIRRKAGKDDDL